jgi:hypothetical protein
LTGARAALLAGALGVLLAASCDRWPGNHNYGPPADPRVVQRLCTSELGSPKAELHVWRDSNDAITVFDLVPDPDGPQKGVTALYDSRGREQVRMPPPIIPSAPEALEIDRRRGTILEDSRRAETIECARDGGR